MCVCVLIYVEAIVKEQKSGTLSVCQKKSYREIFFLMIVDVEHYILFFSLTVQGLFPLHLISLANSPCTFIPFFSCTSFCPFLSRSPASQKCTKSLWSQYMIIYHMHHLQLQHYFPPSEQSFLACFINPYQTCASEMGSSWM